MWMDNKTPFPFLEVGLCFLTSWSNLESSPSVSYGKITLDQSSSIWGEFRAYLQLSLGLYNSVYRNPSDIWFFTR